MSDVYQEWVSTKRNKVYDEWVNVTRPKRPTPRAKEREAVDSAVDTLGAGIQPAQTVLFDYMQRGQFASAGAADKALEGNYKEIPKAIGEGLAGKEMSYVDVIQKHRDTRPSRLPASHQQDPMHKFFEDILPGLALDVMLDPTMYVPITAPFKIGAKVAKATGVPQKISKKISKSQAAKTFNKMFRPSGGLPRDYYESKLFAKYGFEEKQVEILKFLKKTTKGLTDDDLQFMGRLRSTLRTDPSALERMNPAWRHRYSLMADAFEKQGQTLVDAGELSADSFVKMKDWYMPGIHEGKYRPFKGDVPPTEFHKSARPSYQKQKHYPTPLEAEQAGLKPEFNMAYLLGANMRDAAAFRTKEKFVNDVLENFGTKYVAGGAVPEGFGVYYPKGKLKFSKIKMIDAGFEKELEARAQQLRKFWDESQRTTKTTTKQTIRKDVTGGAYKDTSQSNTLQKVEQIIKESLESRGITAGEANAYVERIKGGGSDEVKEIIEEITKEVTDSSYVKGMVQEFQGDLIPYEKISDGIGVSKKVPAYMLPEEVADDMNRVMDFFNPDPASNWVRKWYDGITGAWKTEATALRLPFHLRNMQTNWWMMWLGGVSKHPLRIEQATRVQSGLGGSMKLGDTVYTIEELKKLAGNYGIHGRGWLGADIPEMYFKRLKEVTKDGMTKKALKNLNPAKWGRGMGTFIEDNARIGLFLDGLAKGKSPEDASRAVRKYLFDYGELTEFEKNTMKRVFPFYTWTRKSAPLMMEEMYNQPAKFAVMGKAHLAWDKTFSETEIEKKNRPDYYNELLYQKVGNEKGKDGKKGKPIYAHLDLPYMEINRLFKLGHWMSSVQPLPFKLVWDYASNTTTFPEPGTPIARQIINTKTEGTKESMVPAPFYVMWLYKGFKEKGKEKMLKDMLGIDWMINPDTKERDVLGMPARKQYVLSTIFPMFSEADKAFPQAIKRQEEKSFWKKVSYGTGIKFDVNDPEMQAKYKLINKRGKLNELKSLMYNTGEIPSTELLNEILNNNR